jgi:hypothetical protein
LFRKRFGLIALTVSLATLGILANARANPRPLPFTYQSETLAKGTGEIEQFIDFNPVRAVNGNSGEAVWYNSMQLQTEIEYGVTDKLELALYFMFVPTVSADRFAQIPQPLIGNGSAQRLRYRFADPGAWPIDVAVYGEVTENEREIELEAKVILQRRIGRLRLMTNLWAEHEFYFNGEHEWVINPTLGGTVELSPRFHVGMEGWLRAEFSDEDGGRVFNQGPYVYVGPAFMVNLGPVWFSTGAYLRVTDLDRAVQVTDEVGRIWVRTIAGIGF